MRESVGLNVWDALYYFEYNIIIMNEKEAATRHPRFKWVYHCSSTSSKHEYNPLEYNIKRIIIILQFREINLIHCNGGGLTCFKGNILWYTYENDNRIIYINFPKLETYAKFFILDNILIIQFILRTHFIFYLTMSVITNYSVKAFCKTVFVIQIFE